MNEKIVGCAQKVPEEAVKGTDYTLKISPASWIIPKLDFHSPYEYKACNVFKNGYEQTNTVLWILNYRKNNSIIEHQRRYTIEVYKDGTYSIVEKEEVWT